MIACCGRPAAAAFGDPSQAPGGPPTPTPSHNSRMHTFSKLALLLLVGTAVAADSTPPTTALPVAHSALLTIDATPTADGVALHVKHASNQVPIDGQNVTVS